MIMALLVDVQRTLMKAIFPGIRLFSSVAAPVFSLPAGLIAQADGMWISDLLPVYRYRISNRQQHVVLSESQFRCAGMVCAVW